MNNDSNLVRAKHLESTANVAKNFLVAQISDVTAAISSELVNLNGMTLGTTQPTTNGALWYQLVDGEPQLRIHYGGHDYSISNSPQLTVMLNTGSEISYGTPCTATVTYRGAGTISVSASDSLVTPAYSDGTITIPWAAVTGSITITVSLSADGTFIAEEKSFTVSMLQDNPGLTVTPATTTLNLAGTTASVTRNGSGMISVVSDNENVTPTISGSTITIPYAVFDEDTDVTFTVSIPADSGYAADEKSFTVTYVSPLVVNMPFDTSTTQDLCGNTWTAYGSPSIVDKYLNLPSGSYLMNNSVTVGGKDFTINGWCYMNSSSGSYARIFDCHTQASDSTNSIVLSRYSTNSNFTTYINGNNSQFTGTFNQWFHFEMVYLHSSTTAKIFINGSLANTRSATVPNMARKIYLGKSSWSSDGAFVGYIDDFKVYDGVALHTANFTPPARSA